MKKTICVILAFLAVLALASCGGKEEAAAGYPEWLYPGWYGTNDGTAEIEINGGNGAYTVILHKTAEGSGETEDTSFSCAYDKKIGGLISTDKEVPARFILKDEDDLDYVDSWTNPDIVTVYPSVRLGTRPIDPASEVYMGEWVSGDVTISIYPEDAGYKPVVRSGETEWYFACMYDSDKAILADAGMGVKCNTVYNDDGSIASSEDLASGLAATFTIKSDGTLIWDCGSETIDDGLVFTKAG